MQQFYSNLLYNTLWIIEKGRIRSKVVAKIDNTENVSVCKFLEGESIDTIWKSELKRQADVMLF